MVLTIVIDSSLQTSQFLRTEDDYLRFNNPGHFDLNFNPSDAKFPMGIESSMSASIFPEFGNDGMNLDQNLSNFGELIKVDEEHHIKEAMTDNEEEPIPPGKKSIALRNQRKLKEKKLEEKALEEEVFQKPPARKTKAKPSDKERSRRSRLRKKKFYEDLEKKVVELENK